MEQEIFMEAVAHGITRTHKIVVYLMMMTFLQTQCAAHAKVRFYE